MLSPSYIENATKGIEQMFNDLETQILIDIANWLAFNDYDLSSTAGYELAILEALGIKRDEIAKRISAQLNKSESAVLEMLRNGVNETIDYDNAILKEAFDKGLLTSFVNNKDGLKDLIISGAKIMNDQLFNICNTSAQAGQDVFVQALDNMYLAISSGATTYDEAVAVAVKELSKKGLTTITYNSGYYSHIDTAVRTALRTGLNQTACKAQEKNLDDFGCNIVETTSHLGARPDHTVWQGRKFWRIKPYGNLLNFIEATGYGTGEGLGGYNCRHSFFPYFPGISTKSFRELDTKENKELYKLTQEQRYLERNYREWRQRALVMKAGGQDNSYELRYAKEWKNRLNTLIKNNQQLKRDYSRETI